MKPLTVDDCLQHMKEAETLEEWMKWERLLRKTAEFDAIIREKQREMRRTLRRISAEHSEI